VIDERISIPLELPEDDIISAAFPIVHRVEFMPLKQDG
jgi:hypothetical protein